MVNFRKLALFLFIIISSSAYSISEDNLSDIDVKDSIASALYNNNMISAKVSKIKYSGAKYGNSTYKAFFPSLKVISKMGMDQKSLNNLIAISDMTYSFTKAFDSDMLDLITKMNPSIEDSVVDELSIFKIKNPAIPINDTILSSFFINKFIPEHLRDKFDHLSDNDLYFFKVKDIKHLLENNSIDPEYKLCDELNKCKTISEAFNLSYKDSKDIFSNVLNSSANVLDSVVNNSIRAIPLDIGLKLDWNLTNFGIDYRKTADLLYEYNDSKEEYLSAQQDVIFDTIMLHSEIIYLLEVENILDNYLSFIKIFSQKNKFSSGLSHNKLLLIELDIKSEISSLKADLSSLILKYENISGIENISANRLLPISQSFFPDDFEKIRKSIHINNIELKKIRNKVKRNRDKLFSKTYLSFLPKTDFFIEVAQGFDLYGLADPNLKFNKGIGFKFGIDLELDIFGSTDDPSNIASEGYNYSQSINEQLYQEKEQNDQVELIINKLKNSENQISILKDSANKMFDIIVKISENCTHKCDNIDDLMDARERYLKTRIKLAKLKHDVVVMNFTLLKIAGLLNYSWFTSQD